MDETPRPHHDDLLRLDADRWACYVEEDGDEVVVTTLREYRSLSPSGCVRGDKAGGTGSEEARRRQVLLREGGDLTRFRPVIVAVDEKRFAGTENVATASYLEDARQHAIEAEADGLAVLRAEEKRRRAIVEEREAVRVLGDLEARARGRVLNEQHRSGERRRADLAEEEQSLLRAAETEARGLADALRAAGASSGCPRDSQLSAKYHRPGPSEKHCSVGTIEREPRSTDVAGGCCWCEAAAAQT